MSGVVLQPVGHGAGAAPSPWVTRWAHLAAPGCEVLDLACGAGRHTRFFAASGHSVLALDRDTLALDSLARLPELQGRVKCLAADIEQAPWPLAGQQFGLVVVTNYLWRPLLPAIVAAVAPGGVLLYETFAIGHERVGRPSRPDFLLQPGELLSACATLRVIGYEDGTVDQPLRVIQRIAAVRQPEPSSGTLGWPLAKEASAAG
ncbi:class I SAM-dependent methyltransferase [Ideonella sp.]|uniref:class I SAM-dependent methyltransferase n=1 Tax=Ideonella sp. TaxID=1929293 RepID=UPI0037BF4F01